MGPGKALVPAWWTLLFAAALAGPGLPSGTPPAVAAPAGKTRLGSLDLNTWDARRDVFFKKVTVWREGCDLVYHFTYKRERDHELKIRLQLSLDAGPDQVVTPWADSREAGEQEARGRVETDGCWVKRARRLKRVQFDALGAPPRRAAGDGRLFLGRVTFNRWGSSGDVYYRHIQAWRKGCHIHYQFLYKRRTSARRRIRLKLVTDAGTLHTTWHRSKKQGWREIVGSRETPDCFAKQARTLRSAAFESERY